MTGPSRSSRLDVSIGLFARRFTRSYSPLAMFLCACEAPVPLPSGAAFSIEGLAQFTIHEELRIGSVDDPDYGFSQIGQVEVDEQGAIYVFESQDFAIRVYSPDGRLVRTIGRRGEGPGEFRNDVRFGILSDTVWTVNNVARRLAFFTRDGDLLSTAPFEPVRMPGKRAQEAIELTPEWLQAGSSFISDARPGWVRADFALEIVADSLVIPRVRFSTGGDVIDTVGRYVVHTEERGLEEIEVGRSRYFVPNPPPSRPFTTATATGRRTIDTPPVASEELGEFHITWYDLNDAVTRRATYAYRPVRYSADEIDAVVAAAVRQGTAQTSPPGAETLPRAHARDSAAAHAAIKRRLSYPEFKLPWHGWRMGSDGALWIQPVRGVQERRWVVLDVDGRPRGELQLPEKTRIAWSRGSHMIVTYLDDLDVPWLVRYRIEDRP